MGDKPLELLFSQITFLRTPITANLSIANYHQTVATKMSFALMTEFGNLFHGYENHNNFPRTS